jgi:hypothetical protein
MTHIIGRGNFENNQEKAASLISGIQQQKGEFTGYWTALSDYTLLDPTWILSQPNANMSRNTNWNSIEQAINEFMKYEITQVSLEVLRKLDPRDDLPYTSRRLRVIQNRLELPAPLAILYVGLCIEDSGPFKDFKKIATKIYGELPIIQTVNEVQEGPKIHRKTRSNSQKRIIVNPNHPDLRTDSRGRKEALTDP